jgi:phosphatidylglycerol---prolipoprotein diacylglyceryl transferase
MFKDGFLTWSIDGVALPLPVRSGVLFVAIFAALRSALRNDKTGRVFAPNLLPLTAIILGVGGTVSYLTKALIWDGSLGFGYGNHFYGWSISAALGAWCYFKLRKVDYRPFADVAFPAVLLASAIGRWSCLAAGCCHGFRCGPPLGLKMLIGTPDEGYYFPAQICCSASDAVAFLFVTRFVRPRASRPGTVGLATVAAYALGRFNMEFLRDEPRYALGLTLAQWISVVLLTGVGLTLVRPRNAVAVALGKS